MAAAPIYAATPKQWQARVDAANTNRDGSGTLVDLVPTSAAGGRVDRIRVRAEVTTTAGMFRLWHFNGSAYRLLDEAPVSAITPSATVEVWKAEFTFPGGLQFEATHKLAITMHKAEAVNAFAEGALY